MKNIRIIPLGGACEVGSNSYYVDWDGKYSFLLDCGINGDGPTIDNLPRFDFMDTKVDFIVITHAHNDHIAALPFAEKYVLNNNGKIFMTSKTKDIAEKMLKDSGKIVHKSENKIFTKLIKNIYSDESIINLIKNRVKDYDYLTEFSFGNLKLVFYDAGHVLGSAMVYIKDEDTSLLYTGDFCDSPSFIEKGVGLPDNLEVDIMISEGTNGDKRTENEELDSKVLKMANLINRTLKRKGRVLFPSFALGRTQEILVALEKAKEKNLIDKSVKYYLSKGLADIISKVYTEKGIYLPSYKTLKHGRNPKESESVYIATSGFFSKKSPAREYADNTLFYDANSTVIFPSSYVVTTETVQKWMTFSKCSVESIDFSAHADLNGILNTIKKLKPKKVILVHGNENALLKIKNTLEIDKIDTYIPSSNGEEIIITKQGDNLSLRTSNSNPSYIVTVGMSMLSVEKKNIEIKDDNTAKKVSAELNTLLSIDDFEPEKSIINLVCTEGSKEAGLKIKKYLEIKNAVVIIHNTDVKSDGSNFSVKDITTTLSRLISRYSNSYAVITGGYKFETGISYLLAALFGSKIYYKNEYNKLEEPAFLLDTLPVELDIKSYLPNIDIIKTIILTDTEDSGKEFEKLPSKIKTLFKIENNTYLFTPVGSIIYNYAVRLRNLDRDLMKKMAVDIQRLEIERWKQKIINKEFFFPSLIDKSEILREQIYILSPELYYFMNMLVISDDVVKIKFFGAEKIEGTPVINMIEIKLKEVKRGKILFELISMREKQLMEISLNVPGYEQRVLELVGINKRKGKKFSLRNINDGLT